MRLSHCEYKQRVVPFLGKCQHIQELFVKRDFKENASLPKRGKSNLGTQFKPPQVMHLIDMGIRPVSMKEKLMLPKNFLSKSKN